jgi:hypothetical protein
MILIEGILLCNNYNKLMIKVIPIDTALFNI